MANIVIDIAAEFTGKNAFKSAETSTDKLTKNVKNMAKTLGVFLFTLTSVVGQLSGAILMDVVFPTAATNITWQLLLGISMTGAAVVLASGKQKVKT